MSTPEDPEASQPDRPAPDHSMSGYEPGGGAQVTDKIEPLSPDEIAALTAAGVLDNATDEATSKDAVPVSGWRVRDLGQAPAFGVPGFHGLTPSLAAVLVARYSRPGQLVLDLSADLAVEGVAGAGARRYVRVHPAAAGVLLDARQRGDWPPADLLLIRWPPHPTPPPDPAPDLDAQLARLLGDCRNLLAPQGRLIAVIGLGHAEPTASTRAVLETAARTRLQLAHHHIAVAGSTAGTASETTAPPPSAPPRHIDLLVFTRGDHDD